MPRRCVLWIQPSSFCSLRSLAWSVRQLLGCQCLLKDQIAFPVIEFKPNPLIWLDAPCEFTAVGAKQYSELLDCVRHSRRLADVAGVRAERREMSRV